MKKTDFDKAMDLLLMSEYGAIDLLESEEKVLSQIAELSSKDQRIDDKKQSIFKTLCEEYQQ